MSANARYVQLLAEIRERQSSIAELRKDLGLTQEEVAGLLDVTQGAVSKMERSGSIEKLASLIQAMGASCILWRRFLVSRYES